MPSNFEVILFDLGGVLLELGPSPVPERAIEGRRGLKLGDWFSSETAIAFEKGAIGPESFARALIAELDLDCHADELIEHFSAWPRGLYPGAAELLEHLRSSHRLALLTNTNELHWRRFVDEIGLPQRVDHVFASHQIGLVKPEADIYRYILAQLDCAASRVLFIDDNAENVAGAKSLGLEAVQAQGLRQVEAALARHGIILS